MTNDTAPIETRPRGAPASPFSMHRPDPPESTGPKNANPPSFTMYAV